MELSPILKLGAGDAAVDLSDYIVRGDYSVTETPVYDETSTAAGYISAEKKELFTAVSGKKYYDTFTGEAPTDDERIVCGKSISISAYMESVPGSVCAAALALAASAKGTSKLAVTYAAPLLTSANFDYPTITTELENEADGTYNVSFSAVCPLLRFEGL